MAKYCLNLTHVEKEKPQDLVLANDGPAEQGKPLTSDGPADLGLTVSVRDGELVIAVPLAEIADRVSWDWENPVRLFDQEAFGKYLAEYLRRDDSALVDIRSKIEYAVSRCLEGAGEIRAGVRPMTEDVSMLVEWMWEQRSPPPDYYEAGERSLHDLVCEAAIAGENGEHEKAVALLRAPWHCIFFPEKPGEVIEANGREAVETAMLLYAKRAEP